MANKVFLGYKIDEVASEVPGIRHMPAGSYLMKVEDVGDWPTWEKDSVTPALDRQIRIQMSIMDCPASVNNNEVVGRGFSEFISKKLTVAFRVKQFTDAAAGHGVAGEELDPDMFKEKLVVIQAKDDTWTNPKDGVTTLRSRVDRFLPGSDWKGTVPKAAPAPNVVIGSPIPAAIVEDKKQIDKTAEVDLNDVL